MEDKLPALRRALEQVSAADGLKYLDGIFDHIRFSSALGLEDQVITHMIANQSLNVQIFTIDTGRLFQETQDLIELTRARYHIKLSTFYPDTERVQTLVSEKGPNSFYQSVENRKECCYIRKVEPLKRALTGAQVWITGIRADQSLNRTQMEMISWDETHNVIKYNPLLHWSINDVEQYLIQHQVPVNALHRQNFPSIGCAPCTRAVQPGEDVRAGRWWWETSAKECGLHESKI